MMSSAERMIFRFQIIRDGIRVSIEGHILVLFGFNFQTDRT